MNCRFLGVVCVLGLMLMAAPPVAAQSLNVAIVAAAQANDTDCRFTDTQARLLATGIFASVDIINTTSTTPDLATLLNYDACICWTNTTPTDNVAWGNVMADYVDAGGGVVVAVFAISDTLPARALGGRWQTDGYEIVVPLGGTTTGNGVLGTINDPGHPIMQGVMSFNGGTNSFRPTLSNTLPGSEIIAEWSDGRILVAVGPNPRRADLGFYPPSNVCSAGFHDPNTDGFVMMANALEYVASGGPVGPTFIRGECNDDGSVNLPDVVFLLTYLFPPMVPPAPLPCDDSCDVNDDGSLNLVDAIGMLNFLFGMPPIPIAGPDMCGVDPTPADSLGCVGLSACP